MISWFTKLKIYFKQRSFLLSLGAGFILLIISLFINFYAGLYATKQASNAVTDLILSNIRVYDVDWLFIYGPFFFLAFVIIICLREPKRIPFVLKSVALFTIVRAIFISLTHIGPFPISASIDSQNVIDNFSFGGDLFFSGHTGLPFLMALLFSGHEYLRDIFIALSIFFGLVVLMGHIHYSIDVFSAFFITYGIYHMACFIFAKDKILFES